MDDHAAGRPCLAGLSIDMVKHLCVSDRLRGGVVETAQCAL